MLRRKRFLFSFSNDHRDFANVQWADSIPKLLQEKLIQSFENYDIAHAPLRSIDGLEADDQLLIDVRSFEIKTDPDLTAEIGFSAGTLAKNGHVVASRVFQQSRKLDKLDPISIMTSNLGSEYLVTQPEGEDTSAVHKQVMGMVRAHFRPEFLNRVDEIILFHRLQKSEMGRIVEIQFARLQKLVEERKIVLTLDAAARDWLAAKGWDPAYGARPLKRVIQRNVQDPLAEMILAGEVQDGDSIAISTEGNVLTFNGKAPQTAEIAQFEAPVAKRKLH